MKTSSLRKRNAYLVIGGFGLFFTAGYLGMSFQLPFGQIHQPGAAVFPIIVGVTLMLASLITMWEGWQMDKAERVDLPAGKDRKRLVSLIVLLVGYFIAMPYLGQFISSTLFCIFLMRVMSELSWQRIVAYSMLMSIVIYFVFMFLLKVPMPCGILFF